MQEQRLGSTYEGLKHELPHRPAPGVVWRLGSTYEGLKPRWMRSLACWWMSVWALPMRD